MTNEQLDALFRKVFDESEVGDQQILSGSYGDEIAREETILKNLKSQVKTLGDVPECQLSTDRLREAILNRGAISQKSSFFGSWWKFAMPVAASVALGAFIFTNSQTAHELTTAPPVKTIANNDPFASDKPAQDFVDDELGKSSTPSPESISRELEGNSNSSEFQQNSGVALKSRPVPTVKRTNNTAKRLASRLSAETPTNLSGGVNSQSLMAAALPKSSVVSELAADAIERFESRGAESVATMDSAAKQESGTTVVIVGVGSDPQTRANPAMEVDKKNVVFGG